MICDCCEKEAANLMSRLDFESGCAVVKLKVKNKKMICRKCIAQLFTEILRLHGQLEIEKGVAPASRGH